MTYIAAWAHVIARGHRGSHGTFTQGDPIAPWACGTSNQLRADTTTDDTDHITDTEIQRLLNLGAIKAA